MKLLFFICCIALSLFVFAHEEHAEQPDESGHPKSWTQWVGSFHLIFLHFPIALINMVAISEILFARHKKPIFEFSSRFMLIASAIVSPPTALLGFIYSYSASYSGLMETYLWWHMWFGLATAISTIFVTIIRERFGVNRLYYSSLSLIFLMINITGYFGGGMTFGPYQLQPPL